MLTIVQRIRLPFLSIFLLKTMIFSSGKKLASPSKIYWPWLHEFIAQTIQYGNIKPTCSVTDRGAKVVFIQITVSSSMQNKNIETVG